MYTLSLHASESALTPIHQDTLFQVGTVASLLSGAYEGDIDFDTLALHGDTGLGTFDRVDGELIALDGFFYRIDANGVAKEVAPETCTPFAVVSHFRPTIQFSATDVESMDSLILLIDNYLSSPDIFYMIRIDAELDYIHYRSEFPQTKPYRPLLETLHELQQEFKLNHTYATLIGLKSPSSSKPLNSPGHHFHFIDEDRKTGGHVFDLRILNATIRVQPLSNWNIHLINK
jgi:acetolactate decarboxylase